MDKQLIPLITPDMYRNLPDQTTEILNRLIMEVNDSRLATMEMINAIIVLQNKVEELEHNPIPPEPTEDFIQILAFDPQLMGHETGQCLKNCRLGFGIQTGTSTTAYNDMLYNKDHGTLHEEIYPPSNIQVPIYIRTFGPNHHVVVWDQGTVYDDGLVRSDWLNYYGAQNIFGWGELMDTVRVVMPES